MPETPTDPEVQALLDEAYALPDSAARDAIFESAARRAEALGDLDTAWDARCAILQSAASHAAPKFETLFMCLAWCFAVSDDDPDRFNPASILWQYKWIATDAPGYASVPRAVLERIVDDMDDRFVRAGWGRRAGLHKRIDLAVLLGEYQRARELIPAWLAAPRDRGSDCLACERDTLVWLHAKLGDHEAAWREAKPIVRGQLSCATVPHSTFGRLLTPLVRLRLEDKAAELYQRGRRLVAGLDEGAHKLISPYFLHAARTGRAEECVALIRNSIRPAADLRADLDRLHWFGRAGCALSMLAEQGVGEVELPAVGGLTGPGSSEPGELARRFLTIAGDHAAALDQRNGNSRNARWLHDPD
ncbi:MAG: hypothetical protein IT431_05100 [Phycisphaerales bacterium]|nr:hypothetical protein [Phycisphaerales bacterium]